MANWSKRMFAAGPHQVGQWAAVQDAFDTHYMRVMPFRDPVNNPAAMMLLISENRDSGEVTLFMALPDGVALHEGFEAAQFSEIPPSADLLYGSPAGYDQLFGDPEATDFTVDLDARAARHISGAVVRFYEFLDDATWRESIPETIQHANRFKGSLHDLVRVAQEAAIAAGMTHKKP